MIIGVTKEIKNNENRVGITPANIKKFIENKHTILIESNAGLGSGFSDEEYRENGAIILQTAKEVWEKAEMIIKVKEPLQSEYKYFRPGLIIFTYLHLAADRELTEEMLKKKVIGICYETVELKDHSLPLLTPMSQVAGRMSVQIGAHFLEKHYGGEGILLGGVDNVQPGHVVIIGGGIVGHNACQIALGMKANVTLLDLNQNILQKIKEEFKAEKIETLVSTKENLEQAIKTADLVIGAVLIHGAKAPKIITEKMVKSMKKGSVIVDVSIDQGGIVETMDRITTHENPVFIKHDVVHYSVANIPGAVPKTSTLALTTATMPYALEIANNGWKIAVKKDPSLAKGVNVVGGHLVYKAVSEAFNLPYFDLEGLLDE